MLLTEDGFLTLVADDVPPTISQLDNRSWSVEWNSYYSEAMRWDDRGLNRVFGASSSGHMDRKDLAQYLKFTSFKDPESWTLGNRRLVGEFVRRHHARIGHEIAFDGMPGVSNTGRFRIVEGPAEFLDLCGLVARSHNMNLRSTFSYLKNRFHSRTTVLQTHPIYLMVVLRIADFLQVEASRAPSSSLLLRSLRNPISQLEWELHHSITEVRPDEEDEEAIFIRAKPTTSRSFRRLQALLAALQHELDHSWAVLGEVYSSKSIVSNLGIKLRRVRSNLENVSQFANEVSYIPDHFVICTAGNSLLKKLVTPLYGDRPVVAIRELLQNSIDAVNELHAIQQTPQESLAEVAITLNRIDDGTFSFTIEDRGVGMDATTIRDYFLKAGASFRDSDAWRQTFLRDGVPEVIRSGRFGIGVLAAFLLGSKLSVVTRHYRSNPDHALSFSALFDDDDIEVSRAFREHPGTTIQVALSQEIFERLSQFEGKDWEWYRWRSPVVNREIDGLPNLPRLTQVPMPGDELEPEWHRLKDSTFDEVLWTYGRTPRLVVNGLVIGSEGSSHGYSNRFHWEGDAKSHAASQPLQVPYVAVTDRKGLFPIDLQRYSMISHCFPFKDALTAEATHDFVAYLLLTSPSSIPNFPEIGRLKPLLQYPGRESNRLCSFAPVVDCGFTTDGVVPLHWANLCQFTPETASVILTFDCNAPFPSYQIQPDELLCLATIGHTPAFQRQLPMALMHLLGRTDVAIGPHDFFFTQHDGCRLLMPEFVAQVDRAHQHSQFNLSGVRHYDVGLQRENKEPVPLHIWNSGGWSQEFDQNSALRLGHVVQGVLAEQCLFAEMTKPKVHYKAQDDAFAQTWRELMPSPVIPYDAEKRKTVFSETYKRVAGFIEKWQRLFADANWRRRFYRDNYTNERI